MADEYFLDLINHQKAEIERLSNYNTNLQTANTALSNEILEIKFKVIKEFADNLKHVCAKRKIKEKNILLCSEDIFDELVQKMIETKE